MSIPSINDSRSRSGAFPKSLSNNLANETLTSVTGYVNYTYDAIGQLAS